MKRLFFFTPIAVATLWVGSACADVTLPPIIGNNMVLQSGTPVRIWGWAAPGESVTVKLGKAKAATVANPEGKWKVSLPAQEAGPLPEMTITGKNALTVTNILAGDVWVCSGQSNMEMGAARVGDAADTMRDPGTAEIRLFFVPRSVKASASETIDPTLASIPLGGAWQVCTPEALAKDGTWSGFSALGYRFGREMHDFTHKPVGLIGSYWGGTSVQSWTSEEALAADPILKPQADRIVKFRNDYDHLAANYETVEMPNWKAALAKWKEDNKDAVAAYPALVKAWDAQAKEAKLQGQPIPPRPQAPKEPMAPRDPRLNPGNPAVLFNGMISPLLPYAIKGAIWYQGENNSWSPVEYRTSFPAMIKDWRARWGVGDFPFLFVQLANYKDRVAEPADSDWAALREAQTMALKLPNTGMAVIIDIGDGKDIHPLDKFDVGRRLALAARKVAYGEKALASGPVYQSMRTENGKIRLTFDSVGGGLILGVPPEHFIPREPRAPQDHLTGFAIAGADQHFVWADAVIDKNEIVVSSPQVSEPVSVRYAWADNPECNLYNKEGLPASPFRTDTWPVGEELRALKKTQ